MVDSIDSFFMFINQNGLELGDFINIISELEEDKIHRKEFLSNL